MRIFRPLILILDEDPAKSAEYMTDDWLDSFIYKSNQIMISSVFFYAGIRSKRHYEYYFSEDRREQTLNRYFNGYPLRGFPEFKYYNAPETKWCRQCMEHFMNLQERFEAAVYEYSYRHSAEHRLYDMVYFHKAIPINLTLNAGANIPYAGLKKMDYPYKNLSPLYRSRNIIDGYRKYLKRHLPVPDDPIASYSGSRRSVPEFLVDDGVYSSQHMA